MDNKLPPIPEDSYDGEKFEAPIPKVGSLPIGCDHRNKVTIVGTEVRCQCGTGWPSSNTAEALDLYNKLTSS